MAAGGQTINDRLNAVRYALVGQGLARTVCKATTEEVSGPKKKHIECKYNFFTYEKSSSDVRSKILTATSGHNQPNQSLSDLLACTNEPNVSIPQLANLLIERTQHTSWAVVFKGLTTIHHLMIFGNERFNQYLATSNHSFELNDFMDRATPQGYNMSNFVRRYAKYINNKSISYRTLAIDLCKIKPGNDNALRTMNMDNLSKTLPIVQAQLDSLLEFDVESKDLNNGVIMAAFRLLYKDLNKLYATYQEAIINLVERYFKLSRKKTREALEMYKTFLNRMDKVGSFFKVVDQVGLDKSEMPDLTKFTTLLKLLEDHLATLEAKKRGTTPVAEPEEEPEGGQQKEKESTVKSLGSDKESSSSGVASKENVSPTKPEASKKDQHESKPVGSEREKEKEPATGQPAPPKPARPSPKASPKYQEKQQTGSEKKAAAPERPAKPPSRPPPPSASSPVEPAKKDSSPKTAPPAARPTPPPHPPPPTHPASSSPSDRPAPSSKTMSEPDRNNHKEEETPADSTRDTTTEPEAPSCTSAAAVVVANADGSVVVANDDHNQRDNSSREDTGEPGPSCSAQAAQSQVEEPTVIESNHVNSSNGEIGAPEPPPPVVQPEVEEELVMPPPPPPIEEAELNEGHVEDDGAAVDQVNGRADPEGAGNDGRAAE